MPASVEARAGLLGPADDIEPAPDARTKARVAIAHGGPFEQCRIGLQHRDGAGSLAREYGGYPTAQFAQPIRLRRLETDLVAPVEYAVRYDAAQGRTQHRFARPVRRDQE